MSELNDRLVHDLVEAVRNLVRKEESDGLRDVYLIGDIEKETARAVIERLRELAHDSHRPITLYTAQHLDRLKQMQTQIYRILAERAHKPLRQIIRDTKRTDFYLDAARARDYGLIDDVLGQSRTAEPVPPVAAAGQRAASVAASAEPGGTPLRAEQSGSV